MLKKCWPLVLGCVLRTVGKKTIIILRYKLSKVIEKKNKVRNRQAKNDEKNEAKKGRQTYRENGEPSRKRKKVCNTTQK